MISSSGIKRGVAASAISALAVAGLPFLANSASAAHEFSLDVTSRDGAAFDEDEFDYTATGPGANEGAEESDIVGQVNDDEGNAIAGAGREVDYRWVVTPFDGSPAAADSLQNDEDTVFTDDEGKFSIPRPDVADDDGTWELFVTLVDTDGAGAGTQVGIAESKELTVKSGDSTLAFDETSPEQAQSGTSETVSGSLKLADGTGLAGRLVDVSYAPNAGGNATIQESSGTANDGIVTTDANGNWSVVVKDPAASPQPEEDGTVTAETADQTETDAGTNVDNPEEGPITQGVEFIQSEGAATIAITPVAAGTDTAGEVQDYSVNVKNAEGDNLNNTQVTLTTDHGYFTDGIPQGSVGGDFGVYDNDGQTITVTTDGSGNATFKVSIGRDAGFDDDGDVTAIITATSGSASDTEDQFWTSENPLNGGAVDLVFSPAEEQESGVLPKAPVDDVVLFDVVATDQFGNVVGGESVDITDNTGDADVSAGTVTTDYDDDGDFFASADQQVDQTITATWVTDTEVLAADGPDAGTAPDRDDGPDETLTDAETVNWYEVDYANSTYTLTHSGDDNQPVGSVVTFTYTATDQNGEEISELAVGFFRSGPDEQQDGSQNQASAPLGQDGRITYTFSGDEPGTAVVTALGTLNGDEVPEARRTGSVTFGSGGGGGVGGRLPIDAVLKGRNTGPNIDKLKVVTTPKGRADGAVVNLFRFNKNGVRRLVESTQLNDNGIKRFQVKDRNGRKFTKYVARVKRTDDSKAVKRTNFKRVR